MNLAQGVRYLHLPNVSSPGVPKTTSFASKQPLGHGRNSESGKNCRKLVGTGIQQRCVFSQFSQQSNLTAQHQPISDKIEQTFEGSMEWEEFEGMGNQRN